MLEKLIDFLLDCLRFFQFCDILHPYQDGIILRWGRFHRMARRGLNFYWPFFIETLLHDSVVLETMEIGPHSVTTSDGRRLTWEAIVSFTVEDVKRFLLTVEGGKQAVDDSCSGIISKWLMSRTWQSVQESDANNEVSKACRTQARKWGVGIAQVQFVTLVEGRVLVLVQPPRRN